MPREILVEGWIDLAFEEPEGLVIVDYKTDAWSSDEQRRMLAAHHARQVAFYGKVLEAAGRRVKESWLLFVGAPRSVAERV
ncbi:MAG: PD-(D/E)XK nuclease family protein [Acidobacteriota bacterium]|nr:PD-(D/E)XK nuclease family protein [Acidobacteriota bacterium]